MIDFRYHLVSVIAVFLALAVGIVLGTTLLQDPTLDALRARTSDLREKGDDLRSQRDAAKRLNEGGDQLVAAHTDAILGRRLSGARVVVVESPGADDRARDGVQAAIRQAGGTVSGGLGVTGDYTDADRSTFVGELAGQLAAGSDLPSGNPYDRAGAVLAESVTAPKDGDTKDGETAKHATEDDADAVLAGFAEAGLVKVRGEPARAGRADLAVVLAPERPAKDDRAMLALAGALDRAAEGTALVGGPSAARPGGMVTRARAKDSGLSTVDVAGRPTGNVVSALALASAGQGGSGHYGTGAGADGLVPEPLPEAEPRP